MEYYWLDYYDSVRQDKLREVFTLAIKEYYKCGVDETKRRKRVSVIKLKQTISCFSCNVIRSLNRGCTDINISLDEHSFSRTINGRRNSKVSYTYTRDMLDCFVERGWINLEIGGIQSWKLTREGKFIPDKTTNSKIKIEESLISIFAPFLKHERYWGLDNVLVLRGKDGRDQKFKLVKRGRDMCKELNESNKILNRADITHNGESVGSLQFKRIFNEDFSKGGRFYTDHGIIQCENGETRLEIKIDGESVVELDYKALHPSIAYTKLGVTLPPSFDHYHLDEWRMFGDDYKSVRSFVKTTLLVAINCYSRREAGQAAAYEIYKDTQQAEGDRRFAGLSPDINVYEVLDHLIAKHADIAEQVIYGGFGQQFQFDDSCITEYVFNHFNKKGEPVIGIHDSYIVKASLEEELEVVMYKAFEHVFGDASNCIVEKK